MYREGYAAAAAAVDAYCDEQHRGRGNSSGSKGSEHREILPAGACGRGVRSDLAVLRRERRYGASARRTSVQQQQGGSLTVLEYVDFVKGVARRKPNADALQVDNVILFDDLPFVNQSRRRRLSVPTVSSWS